MSSGHWAVLSSWMICRACLSGPSPVMHMLDNHLALLLPHWASLESTLWLISMKCASWRLAGPKVPYCADAGGA